jgi:hypothetical protein
MIAEYLVLVLAFSVAEGLLLCVVHQYLRRRR